MLARLLGEAEEAEEEERAADRGPRAELHRGDEVGILAPDDGGLLLDAGEAPVQVGHAAEDVDRGEADVLHDVVDGEGDGEEDLDRGEAHEAEVPVEGEVRVGGHELVELPAALEEGAQGEGTVRRGDQTDRNRPRDVEEVGHDGVGVRLDAANALQDVEAVTLVEPVCGRVQTTAGLHELRRTHKVQPR